MQKEVRCTQTLWCCIIYKSKARERRGCHPCHLLGCCYRFVPHSLKLLIPCLLFGGCRWNTSVKCRLIHRAGFNVTEVCRGKGFGGDTSAQGKPQVCHRCPSVSSRICLHISRWRIKHFAVWKSSQWEQLLEGEQYVLILRTSVWGSYNFMVILDVNVSVLLFIWVSFNIKKFIISVACVGSCWNNWRFSS